MTRRPSPEALREAARVAREEGVTLTVERTPDGWVYRISPEAHSGALATTDRDKAACDEAFGL